jgi:hypothetical protein
MLAETSVLTGSLWVSSTVAEFGPCCTAPAMTPLPDDRL